MAQAILSLAGKDEIRRLIALATDVGCPDKYAGKRKTPRTKSALWLEVRWNLSDEKTVQVSTHDISLGGVSFWLRKQVTAGDILFLRDGSDSNPHPWLKIRVTHCINALKGFLVGGEFGCDQ